MYLWGRSAILLRWRLGPIWEPAPYALPPSRSPLWPSVNRIDHPEECHSMPVPPQTVLNSRQGSRAQIPFHSLLLDHGACFYSVAGRSPEVMQHVQTVCVCVAVTSAAVSAAASYSEPGSERLAVSAGSEHASECRQRDPSVHERGSERRAVDRRQVTHSGSRPKNCVSSLLVCPDCN